MQKNTILSNLINAIVKYRKLIIVSLIISFILIFAAIFIRLTNSNQPTPNSDEKPKTVNISNLDNYQKNQPPESVSNVIFQELYRTINYNLTQTRFDSYDDYLTKGNLSDMTITDINIRDRSYQENINQKTGATTVKYIVDIPSLQQSYQIYYRYQPNEKSTPETVYGPLVSCPTPSQLIYDQSNCLDSAIYNEDGTNPPILNSTYADRFLTRITPYTALIQNKITYTATAKTKDSEPYIEITFNACDVGNLADVAKNSYNTYLQNFSLSLNQFKVKITTQPCGS